MAEQDEYKLEKDNLYASQARAGPIDSTRHYSVPVHSSIEPTNPLRGLLERISLDIAEQISKKTGQHVKISLMVEEEKTD